MRIDCGLHATPHSLVSPFITHLTPLICTILAIAFTITISALNSTQMSDDSDNYMDAASFEGSDVVQGAHLRVCTVPRSQTPTEYESSNPSEAFSDDDVEIDDNDAFNVSEPVKPQKSKFDVDYKVYDINDIIANQQSETNQVCSIFGFQVGRRRYMSYPISSPNSHKTLQYSSVTSDGTKRNSSSGTEDPDRILKQVGLAPESSSSASASAQSDSRASSPLRLKRVKGFTCEICFTGSEDTSTQVCVVL